MMSAIANNNPMVSSILASQPGLRKIVRTKKELQKNNLTKNKIEKNNKKSNIPTMHKKTLILSEENIKNVSLIWKLTSDEADKGKDSEFDLDQILDLEEERAQPVVFVAPDSPFSTPQEKETLDNIGATEDEIPVMDLPTVEIQEQPCQSNRFRYSSEQGVVACLHGADSTQNRKTFPKIKISNFDNSIWTKADVYVSCVTHDEDPKPYNHPNMVMNNKRKKGQNCSDKMGRPTGVCHISLNLPITDGLVEFGGIGIRRVTGDEAKKSLEDRERMEIDPYMQGYSRNSGDFDKEVVKLCFQVYLKHINGQAFSLAPLVSNTISHTKSKEMKITTLAPYEAVCDQPQKLIILAEHLPQHKGDVEVMFSIGNWSKSVKPDSQHQNCALQVSTPTPDFEITHRIKAEVKLVRKSNYTSTESLDFFFLPPKINEGQFGWMFRNQDHLGSLPTKEVHIQTAPGRFYSGTTDLLGEAVNRSDLSDTHIFSTSQNLVPDSLRLTKSTELDLHVTQEWSSLDESDIFMENMENGSFGFNLL